LNWAALIEAVLLGGAAAMLLAKAQSGALVFYIHPRYTPLIVGCVVALALLAASRLRALFVAPVGLSHGLRGRYLLLALPLLLGTVVPARPLGAGSLSSAAFDSIAPARADALDDEDMREWNLFQWAVALSVRDDELQGREADVVGFVYHDPQRPLDGFFVVRYVITCCTADGSGAGLPVVWRGAAALPADGWVRVRGKIGTVALGEHVTPALIATEVEPVARPVNPYLYP
jgi:putative membrane protein